MVCDLWASWRAKVRDQTICGRGAGCYRTAVAWPVGARHCVISVNSNGAEVEPLCMQFDTQKLLQIGIDFCLRAFRMKSCREPEGSLMDFRPAGEGQESAVVVDTQGLQNIVTAGVTAALDGWSDADPEAWVVLLGWLSGSELGLAKLAGGQSLNPAAVAPPAGVEAARSDDL